MTDAIKLLLPVLQFKLGDVSDLEEIMKLERTAFSFPWTEGMILSELVDHPFSSSAVARTGKNKQMVGYIFMRSVLEELHLLSVAVHPAWRQKGVGVQLIQQVLLTAFEKGMSCVILEVRVSNRPAQALYQKFGFRQIGVRRNYYCRPTENALLFQYDMRFYPALFGETVMTVPETDRAIKYVHSSLV